MTSTKTLSDLRKRHFSLAALPDTILVPALGDHEPTVKSIEEATVDDIALAMRGAEAEFNTVAERLYALSKLHDLAREAGALGADRALDAVAARGER